MARRAKPDPDGNPNVFKLNRDGDDLWLEGNWANPENQWNPNNEFVFRLRKYFLFRDYNARFFFLGLVRLFFHPPNILPTSSSLSAISSKCWFEISFPSHATDTRNLSVSSVRIHWETLLDLSFL
jgi:hypothetical protein